MTVPNATTRLVDGEPVTTVDGVRHFGGSLDEFPFTDKVVYIGLTALVINVLVSVALTLVFRALKTPAGADDTEPDDYYSDAPGVALPLPGEYLGEDARQPTRRPDARQAPRQQRTAPNPVSPVAYWRRIRSSSREGSLQPLAADSEP